jgi:hypothetical protein
LIDLKRFDEWRGVRFEGENGAGSGSGGSQGGANNNQNATGAGGDNGANAGSGGNQNANSGGGSNAKTVTMTQDELDRMIQDRLDRHDRSQKAKQSKQSKREGMSDDERSAADLEQERTVSAARAKVIIHDKAENACLRAGVSPERVEYAIRMLDLSGIELDENHSVDTKALDAEVVKLTKAFPELFTGASAGQQRRKGGDFTGNNGGGASESMDSLIRRAAGR